MKLLLLILFSAGCMLADDSALHSNSTGKTTDLFFTVPDTIHFKSQIQPLLQKRCSPCHFTGGKMYEKMPFDDGATVVNHQAGILKRIKDEKELALLKEFVGQHKNEK